MRKHGLRFISCASFLTIFVLLASVGRAADVPTPLRSSTREMFANFGFGPAINLSHSPNQFKLTQEFGYHVFGGGDGLAIGAGLQESVGNDIFILQLGPRVWWDIQPFQGLGLYLAPVVQLGYSLWSETANGFGGTQHFFNLQFGFEPRLVISDTAMVFLRLFTIDMFFGNFTAARYDLMFGGGITF